MSAMTARAGRLLLAAIVSAAVGGCGGASQNAAVTIVVPWDAGSPEYAAFLAVVRPFEQEHHVQVIAESSRAPVQQLDADLAAGDLPDVVDLPNPAEVYQYKRRGLKPLAIDLGGYDQPWRGLAELGTHTVYAVPVKADVKSLLWFREGPAPASWTALRALSRHGTPWCLGLASGSASGWPGTDWVADVMLSRYGAAAYTSWLGGQLPWTSADVRYAWNTWGQLMRGGAAITGGAKAALRTAFNDAPDEIGSGQCQLEHGALSALGLSQKSVGGYDYTRFPSVTGAPSAPILVSGDFMAMFTSNPNAEELLAYLASSQAQKRWVKQPGAFAFSASQAVTPADYPTAVQRKIASGFELASGTMMCFGAGDMMGPDMANAFEQAVLDYINNPATLLTLLTGMQQTQAGAGPSPPPLARSACARP